MLVRGTQRRGGRQTAVRGLAVLAVFFGLFLSGTAAFAAGPVSNHGKHLGQSKSNQITPAPTAATSIVSAATPPVSVPASDPNPGDVWVDNVGQPSGPGHEMDPHLQCADIQLWGDKLGDASGSYTVDGWPPSGSQEQDYASGWSYETARGGVQPIGVIRVATLLANARADGDAPINKQGFHFKLQFVQDPQKHKTFWVDCPAAKSAQAGTATPTPASTPTPATPTPASGVLGIQATPTPSPAAAADGVTGGVLGASTTTPSTGAGFSLIPGLMLILLGLATMGLTRGADGVAGIPMHRARRQHWN